MKYLADSHGKHVAGIVTENRELEKQRKGKYQFSLYQFNS